MESPTTRRQIDVGSWSDVGSREALALVASSVAEMVGFEIAVISVVQGDQMYAVTVEGNRDAADAMLGLAFPIASLLPDIERGEDWGRFRFVAHERNEIDMEAVGWVPDIVPVAGPDAWHPLDLLAAPLLGPDGEMIGLLSIDLPISLRRPGPAQRDLLERYAVQTERVLRMAVVRDELAERIRLTDAAQRVVRFATSRDDLEAVLDDCRYPMLEGFRADFLALRIYPTDDAPASGSPPTDLPPHMIEAIRSVGRQCWIEQRVVVVGPDLDPPSGWFLDEATYRVLLESNQLVGNRSIMLAPLGAGSQGYGHVILGRQKSDQPWSPDEVAAAMSITRDIGQAIARSRSRAREQRLVEELRELATYKTEVLHTVSHELKNPLGAVTGYLELLRGDQVIEVAHRRALDAIARATTRMSGVVDDLLFLAQVEDPDRASDEQETDAVTVLHGALDLSLAAARREGLTVDVTAPDREVLVRCPAPELDRVLTNLVSNAIKYTPDGGTISVSLFERAVDDGTEVELAVADRGIGISAADQALLFTEFFRSNNPTALAKPGTGLGLTICRRVLEQHGGRIEVESVLGEGSVFRAFLPGVVPGVVPD